jgi:hypothetical protein
LFSALLNQKVRNATGRFLCIIQQMLRGTGVGMRALRGIIRPGRSLQTHTQTYSTVQQAITLLVRLITNRYVVPYIIQLLF